MPLQQACLHRWQLAKSKISKSFDYAIFTREKNLSKSATHIEPVLHIMPAPEWNHPDPLPLCPRTQDVHLHRDWNPHRQNQLQGHCIQIRKAGGDIGEWSHPHFPKAFGFNRDSFDPSSYS